ncbi:hypothetical protein MTO96_006676 [Rhipicephalus appendiculatus]
MRGRLGEDRRRDYAVFEKGDRRRSNVTTVASSLASKCGEFCLDGIDAATSTAAASLMNNDGLSAAACSHAEQLRRALFPRRRCKFGCEIVLPLPFPPKKLDTFAVLSFRHAQQRILDEVQI